MIALCATAVSAQNVQLTSRDGSIAVKGTLRGYNGEFFRVDTAHGVLTLDAARVSCAGPGCPDRETYVADVTLSGAHDMAAVLMPELIEAFAREAGYTVERVTENAGVIGYKFSDPTHGPVARFSLRLTTSDEGFADLVAEAADIVLSYREVRANEIAVGLDAGIGNLGQPQRVRILSLDAQVPVVSAANPVTGVTVDALAGVFSGSIDTWSELGGGDDPVTPHLRRTLSGLLPGLGKLGIVGTLAADVVFHATDAELAAAVASDPHALGLVAISELGPATPLALQGGCGIRATATKRSLKTGDYPLTRPLYLYTPARRLPMIARDFLSFVQRPAAQAVIRRAGFVDQTLNTVPLTQQGERLINAIGTLGTGTTAGRLRDMVERLAGAERLSVTFRFSDGSSALDAASMSNVALLSRALENGQFVGRELIFAGFSDGEGDAAGNRRLSRARARAVRQAVEVTAQAVDPGQTELSVEGYGESMPMACDEVDWGRRLNRRVEVWLR